MKFHVTIHLIICCGGYIELELHKNENFFSKCQVNKVYNAYSGNLTIQGQGFTCCTCLLDSFEMFECDYVCICN